MFVHSGTKCYAAFFRAYILVWCLFLKALWWGWFNPAYLFIPFGSYVCICQSILSPSFLLPTIKDYLDLLCRRAYVPSWLTCINCLCMVNSKRRRLSVWHSSGSTAILPAAPADYMSEVVCACMYVRYMCIYTHPLWKWSTAVGCNVRRKQSINGSFSYMSL